MKCFVIFAIVVLAVLAAEALPAQHRARKLVQRRPQRVFLVPKYALRRSWQETPDNTPTNGELIVAGIYLKRILIDNITKTLYTKDDTQVGVIDVGAPLIAEDPAFTELDSPSAAIEEFSPELAPAVPTEAAAEEEAIEEEEVAPPTKGSKRPTQQAWPHTFFPMVFGRTSGGSIAVSNSYTTGKGNAMSHSVAFGNGKHNR